MAAVGVLLLTPVTGGGQEVPEIYLYVNDLTSPPALTFDEWEALEDLCFQVDSLTSAEIAVVLVNTTEPLGVDLYAVEVFEANGVGKAGEDNGVLLLVATDERTWRIEVGYGLEGVLNDAKVGRIGRNNLTPHLEAGDFFLGLYEATWEIGVEIVANYDSPGEPGSPLLFVFDWKFFALSLAVAIGVGILTKGRWVPWLGTRYGRGRFGGGRSGGGGSSGRFRR